MTNANIENLSVTRLKIGNGAVTDFNVNKSTTPAFFLSGTQTRTGPTSVAPEGPFIAAVQINYFAQVSSPYAWASTIVFYRDNLTTGVSEELSSAGQSGSSSGANARTASYTFVDMVPEGESFRYRATLNVQPGGSSTISNTTNISSYFVGQTIARK